jgi:hypothetical protein
MAPDRVPGRDGDAPPCPQVGFLGRVARPLPAAENAPGDPQHADLVAGDEVVEGVERSRAGSSTRLVCAAAAAVTP